MAKIALIILLVFVLVQCNLEDPTKLAVEDLFVIDANPASVYANGLDRSKITLTLLGNPKSGLKVSFKTDFGRFSSLPYGIDEKSKSQAIEITAVNQVVDVFLVAGTKVGIATLSATIEGFSQSIDLPFLRYYPQRIKLSSNSYRLKSNGNDTAELTVQLIPQNEGAVVSEGTRIYIEAMDTATNQKKQELYREALSTANGEVKFSLSGRSIGNFKITAHVFNYPEIADSLEIEFYE
jgi:hypothetical protein